ncbi:MAG: succinate dehydrogenase/fumarate reductase iron-sulfur subunit [Candidatus Aminicenantes bacterium]|nr:succinate dehydrogenase/fumarate reductase iron-sulfur subunit [Candidatus Aminicenantes bacterium]MBL7082470.1 succinate dehydrogenase/fumarate reductase iron-sulfur subunit [Candidatus Aminicenantes bacterium]
MKYLFRILRYDPLKDEHPFFQDFFYETDEKKSVIEALMDIRNEQDCTLAFRYSCREAICGSCAMVINGKYDLACRTMLNSLMSSLIVIEPLPNMEIQKDLVVNMDPFFEALNKIEPYIESEADFSEGGYRIEEKEMDKILQYVNCILCGSCYSACPVASRDENYLGPAALAKLYRFVKDPRDKRPFSIWSKVNTEGGVWGCDTVFKCNEVCPKSVRPADGIEALRRKLIVEKIKRIFKFKR